MTRVVEANKIIVDQADFFQADNFSRIAGITTAGLTVKLFYNNGVLVWPLLEGLSVTDAQVKSGSVYWHEITGAAGYYSLRFRPNVTGFWRLVVEYPAATKVVIFDYDVVAQPPVIESGLRTSFVA